MLLLEVVLVMFGAGPEGTYGGGGDGGCGLLWGFPCGLGLGLELGLGLLCGLPCGLGDGEVGTGTGEFGALGPLGPLGLLGPLGPLEPNIPASTVLEGGEA